MLIYLKPANLANENGNRMKPLAPNTLLQNRYLIVHRIGKGGMGDVYLAVDQRLGSAIALKRTLHGDDPQLGEQFEREARTLARLRHPALPKVSDHFIENENQFLVMDHISGDDLSSRLKTTQKPFPLSWVLFWADQLLDALAYLHSHEPPIIHRDIKPQNLKLTDDNNIVLLDFGLSKNTNSQIPVDSGSGGGSTGSVVGYTPHYAPMEQIRGTGTNPRSDIYALSATLYQLLTNVVPPDALSRADFLLSGKNDPLAPINEVNHEIPRSISDVVIKGMSISQDQRFSDAREMQKILRETYSRLQSEAAGKSAAVLAQDELPEAAAVVNETPVVADQSGLVDAMAAKTIPFSMIDEQVVEIGEEHVVAEPEPAANMDATLVMDANAVAEVLPTAEIEPPEYVPPADVPAETPAQSDVKTEVFGASFGDASMLADEPTPAPVDDQMATAASISIEEPEPVADMTVPGINFDEWTPEIPASQPATTSEPPPSPVADPKPASAARPRTAAGAFAPQQPPEKKRGGLILGIVGGILALLVLAGVGGGAAWYFLMRGTDEPPVNLATPTPTPTSTPTPVPTPEETNLPVTNANSNSDSDLNANDNSNSNSVMPTPQPTRPGSTGPTPIPQPTRQGSTVPTPRPPSQTNPKPTRQPQPRPEPTQKTRGTIIPQ